MIEMVMREEYVVNLGGLDACSRQLPSSSRSTIEQQLFVTDLHYIRRPESIRKWCGTPTTDNRNFGCQRLLCAHAVSTNFSGVRHQIGSGGRLQQASRSGSVVCYCGHSDQKCVLYLGLK